jgi:hypothetical protein
VAGYQELVQNLTKPFGGARYHPRSANAARTHPGVDETAAGIGGSDLEEGPTDVGIGEAYFTPDTKEFGLVELALSLVRVGRRQLGGSFHDGLELRSRQTLPGLVRHGCGPRGPPAVS